MDPWATCVDDLDGDLTTNITVAGWVNTSRFGSTLLVYSCEDSRENSANVSRLVLVVDSGLPSIELVGEARLCLEDGVNYIERGAICEDEVWVKTCEKSRSSVTKGELFYRIGRVSSILENLTGPFQRSRQVDGKSPAKISGSVDVDVLGDHYVDYFCVDSVGNNFTVQRRVTVISSEMPGDLHMASFSATVRGSTVSSAPQAGGSGASKTEFDQGCEVEGFQRKGLEVEQMGWESCA